MGTWTGLRELLAGYAGPLDRSPEAVARREAETLAHRQRLQEQEARRAAFWAAVGKNKRTNLYRYDEEVYYAVFVDYAISWDGKTPLIELTIESEGYPSDLYIDFRSALTLMPAIQEYVDSQPDEDTHFTVNGMECGLKRYFNLNRETMAALLVWLTQENAIMEQLLHATN